MIERSDLIRISLAIPPLRDAAAPVIQEFQKTAWLARIPAGRDVFVEGDRVEAIALLVSGVVRVYKIGETGRQITLYRFGDGQSCILTANAILSRKTFPAVATVEHEAEAAMVPADAFRGWVGKYEPWRDFVFELLSFRLASVMELVDEVAFRRMDARLSAYLLEHAGAKGLLAATHQQIASELGSSREVISRLLEDLVERGMVRSGRGEIQILDREALRGLAPQSSS